MIFLSAGFSSALSISPGEMHFDAIKGEEMCKKVTLLNEKAVNVTGEDKWAESEDNKGKLSQYELEASDFEIEINYQKEIENLENEAVDVCVKGNKVGEYLGALTYHIESSGSVSTGVGTWLFVKVTEESSPASESQESSATASSQASSGGGSGAITSPKSSLNDPEGKFPIQELGDSNSQITGQAISDDSQSEKSKISKKSLIAIILVIIALGILTKIYKKK